MKELLDIKFEEIDKILDLKLSTPEIAEVMIIIEKLFNFIERYSNMYDEVNEIIDSVMNYKLEDLIDVDDKKGIN